MAMIGAIASAVGTVASISSQSAAASAQASNARYQRSLADMEARLLKEQRTTQRNAVTAESQRQQAMIEAQAAQGIFMTNMQELQQTGVELQQQHDLAARDLMISQAALQGSTEALNANMEVQNQLFNLARQGEQQVEETEASRIAQDTALVDRATGDTRGLDARREAALLDQGTVEQDARVLLGTLQSQAGTNLTSAQSLIGLQKQLGMNNLETQRTLFNIGNEYNRTLLEAQERAVQLERQLNTAAVNTRLAQDLFSIEAASSSDQVANAGKQAAYAYQEATARASAPSIFSIGSSLFNAGTQIFRSIPQPQSTFPTGQRSLPMAPAPVPVLPQAPAPVPV